MGARPDTNLTSIRLRAAIRMGAAASDNGAGSQNVADGGAQEDGAIITPIRNRLRPSPAKNIPAVARANRDGTREIGGDTEAQRLRGEEMLRQGLRILRGVYGIPAVVNILETKLAEERRLAATRAATAAAVARQS